MASFAPFSGNLNISEINLGLSSRLSRTTTASQQMLKLMRVKSSSVSDEKEGKVGGKGLHSNMILFHMDEDVWQRREEENKLKLQADRQAILKEQAARKAALKGKGAKEIEKKIEKVEVVEPKVEDKKFIPRGEMTTNRDDFEYASNRKNIKPLKQLIFTHNHMLTIRTMNESSQFLFDIPLSDEADEITSIKNEEDDGGLDETDEMKLLKTDKERVPEKNRRMIDYLNKDLDNLIKQSIAVDEEISQLLEAYVRDPLQMKLFVLVHI
jgi:hypothetical protein